MASSSGEGDAGATGDGVNANPLFSAMNSSSTGFGMGSLIGGLPLSIAAAQASAAGAPVGGSAGPTLVETVSLNYEDFSESFLTCGTCLCPYDGQTHTPKLLPCSHTVCRSCLERIVEAHSRGTNTFRCPICRDTIAIPGGGVSALPPSFLVNQLLDLMQRQRRDIIPRCSTHVNQELLFCETCDMVFCTLCTSATHGGGVSEHTVIPFSIAIKRMSEILLFKAKQCMENLNKAYDNVNEETRKLDVNTERACDSVNTAFTEFQQLLEKRRAEVLQLVKKTKDEKKKVLHEQLGLIQSEKEKVESQCEGLQYQIEVRNITKKISDLNEKLDMSTTLSEPRENAFIRFEYKHNQAVRDLQNALSSCGRIRISKTFPALCTAAYSVPIVTHLSCQVTVTTVDYHGNHRQGGGDPLVAELRDNRGRIVDLRITDNGDGSYAIRFSPPVAGSFKLCVSIFDRPIKDSPFTLPVVDHNNPVWTFGSRGIADRNLTQPVSCCIDQEKNIIFVMDTGNSRIKVLTEDGDFLRHVGPHGSENQSATGIAMSPRGTIITINWRSKQVTELSTSGDLLQRFSPSEFDEPIAVAVNSRGDVIVADNGTPKIIVYDSQGKWLMSLGERGRGQGQFNLISSVAVGPQDEIIVADARLQVFDKSGKYLRELHLPMSSEIQHASSANVSKRRSISGMPASSSSSSTTASSSSSSHKGKFGGVCCDDEGFVLATHTEKKTSLVHVFHLHSGKHLFTVDSDSDRLKRPAGLATTSDNHVVVVDLGNDCVKKYRYR